MTLADQRVTPEELAEKLSILTGWEYRADELLGCAHALLALPFEDPRHARLYRAVFLAQEAWENNDWRAVIGRELEFTIALLQLRQ